MIAGFPPTIQLSGIDFTTILPAPTILFLPIFTPGRIIDPAPTNTLSLILTGEIFLY